MAKFVIKNPAILVNGVNFSDHVSKCTIQMKKAGVDTTNFSGGGKEQIAGLKEDSFTVDFQQDFAAASVDATLYPLYNNETEFVVSVNPVAGATTATNPNFSGTCILLDYQPLTGSVGSLSTTSVTFPSQRSGIARATS